MNRRTILSILGAAGATSVSGCSSDGSSDEPDPEEGTDESWPESSGLSVIDQDGLSVTLGWNEFDGATEYTVYVGSEEIRATSDTEVTIEELRADWTYIFNVSATVDGEETELSDGLVYETPSEDELRDDLYFNPVFEEEFADPSVRPVETDGETSFVGIATDGQSGALATSPDLLEWSNAGSFLDSVPNWFEEVEENGLTAPDVDAQGIWAPEMTRFDGRYYGFYTLVSYEPFATGIGVAVADDPTEGFEDLGKVFRGPELAMSEPIDPMFFADGDDLYVSVSGTLDGESRNWIVELERDGDSFAPTGATHHVLSEGSELGGYEGTHIVERDGTFYLFASTGSCCAGLDSTYQVEVARSDTPTGPYENASGEDVAEAGVDGELVIAGSEMFVGPGHNSLVRDDAGTDWLIYHAYVADQGAENRMLCIDPLVWEDGFPTVEERQPSRHGERPTIGGE